MTMEMSKQGLVSRIWPELLPTELSYRIAQKLTNNEVACSLRLVNKAAAALFRAPQYTSVRLSQPVPPEAFAHKWRTPGIMRGMSLKRRRKLLHLTAASGSIANLEVAMECTGIVVLDAGLLKAAAAAHQTVVCEWLLRRGCPREGALEAATGAGHIDMCELLLAHGCPWNLEPCCENALMSAARNGHRQMMDWLSCKYPRGFSPSSKDFFMPSTLAAVAEGFDLSTLQELHRQWTGRQPGSGRVPEEIYEYGKSYILAAAAASPTPDWRAKVEWLESLGYPKLFHAFDKATHCPDALDRLRWLRQRGYPVGLQAAAGAAEAGRLEVLQYTLAEGIGACFFGSDAASVAVARGHLAVLAWLVETPGVQVNLGDVHSIIDSAAQGGSVEVLSYLRGCGCKWEWNTFGSAAAGGNEEAMEWLVQQGCPMEGSFQAYMAPCRNGDMLTLRCLRRLGCPWDRHVNLAHTATVGKGFIHVEVLRWLLEEGCPVEWRLAHRAVRAAAVPEDVKLAALELLQQHQQQRRQRPAASRGGQRD